MEPAPGTLVTRNVKLVRPLGKGGMGSVWVGEHTTLETEVAVKFISPEHADKKRFVARFRREASSAAKIKSPHVVQVFDHGVTEAGVPYIVMELLQGEPLSRRLRRGPLTPREAAIVVSQVAKVLEVAHGQGIVHRDLKPDNLFLLESGYEVFVKVLDFGIAKQLAGGPSEITDTGAMVGTPYYMSPEMLVSPKDADHRVDLWALSVVAYHALTGKLPFRGETLAALSIAIHDGRFEPPSSVVGHLGADIDVWFKLALCRNIAGRFTTAAEMARSLRAAMPDAGDPSGDRTSEPFVTDGLPDTARPSDVVVSSARVIKEGHRESEEDTATEPSEPAPDTTTAADHTVTSDQLAAVRQGAHALAEADTLATPVSSVPGPPARDLSAGVVPRGAESTLEGTTSSGSLVAPGWWRRPRALVILVLFGVAAAAWLAAGRPASAPAKRSRQASPTPSGVVPQLVAASSARAREPVSPATPAPSARPTASAASTRVARARATARARGPLLEKRRSTPPLTAEPRAKCANPFVVDANGDLQPRPGCF